MKRIEIELIGSYGRLLDREPIFITDECVKIDMKTGYQLGEIIVQFKNGDKTITRHFSYKNEVFVPKEVLFAGQLEIIITLICCGIAVKKFMVEPIVLREVDSSFEAYSEVADLKQQIIAKDEQIEILNAHIGLLQTELTSLKAQVGRLWEIAES